MCLLIVNEVGPNIILTRIHIVLTKSHTNRIGLIQKPNEFMPKKAKDPLEVMAQTHFKIKHGPHRQQARG